MIGVTCPLAASQLDKPLIKAKYILYLIEELHSHRCTSMALTEIKKILVAINVTVTGQQFCVGSVRAEQ